ncbi:ArdC-like ssDNA-binding domain-containing protein [Aliarcobacter butzleri]|uniref:ArdC-like ssDNA-binding domain-containing protein n=1 Tax=Aliarcobacter butzleri TaxID=28197 RepID=UPI00344F5BBE
MTNTTTTKGNKMTVAEMLFNATEKVSKHVTNLEVHVSVSGNEFKGLNLQLLDLEGKTKNYSSNVWFTEKQMEEAGLTFKENAGYGVQLFSKNIKEDKTTVRYWTVYNKDQLIEKAA